VSVLSLITAKGQPVTLAYHAAAPYDLATNQVTITDTVVETVGVVFPLSRGLKHMPRTNISIDDQQLLLPGNIEQPPVDTTVTIGGKDFTIIEVAPLAPNGTAQVYDCMIRGVP
jgi:hypothetical protein